MPGIKGGCLCGQVRYSANAEPVFVGVCHCKDCQKETGSAFMVAVAIPQAAVSVQGPAKTYATKADSGKSNVRRLCPNCGSTILSQPEGLPGVSVIRAGTLDDTSWVKPGMEIYCDSKQSWVQLGGGIASFPKMPPIPG